MILTENENKLLKEIRESVEFQYIVTLGVTKYVEMNRDRFYRFIHDKTYSEIDDMIFNIAMVMWDKNIDEYLKNMNSEGINETN